jgi:hypothetical protein
MRGRCLAVLPDDAGFDGGMPFVKVAEFGTERVLFFSSDDACSDVLMPSEWQTRAIVDARGGGIPPSYFPPPQDYTSFFVLVLGLLPREILAAKPRLLILGGGGGLLATLYRQTVPGAAIDVVEPSRAVLTLAKRYFGLRCAGATRCHRARAQHFVRRRGGAEPPAAYDLIALDAFENDGDESATPRAWAQPMWCARLAALLHAGHGVLAANLYAADETSVPFRAHCDARLHSDGGSRIILQPGRSHAMPNPPVVQTVEAWSRVGAMAPRELWERAEAVLRRRDAPSAREVSQRVQMAWLGQTLWGLNADDARAPARHECCCATPSARCSHAVLHSRLARPLRAVAWPRCDHPLCRGSRRQSQDPPAQATIF